MFRCAAVAVCLALTLPGTPCLAVAAKDKMATCKFGADDQKLRGAARAAFIKKCMADRDEPRGAPPPPKN